MKRNDYDSGKATAVKVFMVLTCIATTVGGIAGIAEALATHSSIVMGVLALVDLVWCIPMMVFAFKRLNGHGYIGTGFKVCTLIFQNLIAGIILLCMQTDGIDEDDYD